MWPSTRDLSHLLVDSPEDDFGFRRLLATGSLYRFSFLAAVFGPDVRRGPRGGERRAGAEPQSGDRSEAAELLVTTHLAARNQPHELPPYGKHSIRPEHAVT